MEMLHAQVISEQLLYLRVPAPCTAAGLRVENHRTGKTKKNLIFPLDGGKNKSTSEPHGAPQQGHYSIGYRVATKCFPDNGKIRVFLILSHGEAPLD